MIFERASWLPRTTKVRTPNVMQTLHLIGEEPRRRHRGLVAVVEVARQQERIHLLGDAEVDDAHEGLARGVADQRGELGIAQRERAERRIEMDVGGVDEAIGHELSMIFGSEPCDPLSTATPLRVLRRGYGAGRLSPATRPGRDTG